MKKALLLLLLCKELVLPVFGQQKSALSGTLPQAEVEQRYLIKRLLTSVSHGSPSNKMVSPEQDCIAAIPLCDSVYVQTNSYSGQGLIQNEIDPSASCLLSGEKNDVWYTFTVQASGILNFSITPVNGNDDYDWALFNLTNHTCADIFTTPSLEVSCNYAPNLGCGGVTGANNDTTGTCGGQNEKEVPVLAGETYVINVSNFSSTQFGYTIDFGSSSAVIYDDVPPQPTVTGMNCTDSSFIVSYPSELIDCSTIAPDGSDFIVMDFSGNPHPVLLAAGIGCSGSQPYVTQVLITMQAANVPFPGFYLLTQTGTDGNTFADKCGNFSGTNGFTDTVAYVNVLNNVTVDIGPDTSVCAADAKPLLNAANSGAGFSWDYNGTSTGISTGTFQTGAPGTYTVTVTYGANCSASDSMTLTFLPGFSFNLGNDTTICQGNPLPVLHTGISNAVSYQWYLNGSLLAGQTADSLVPLTAGMYVAAVDSGSGGCAGVDTINLNGVFPWVFDLGSGYSFCQGDSILVAADTISSNASYQWTLNGIIQPATTSSIYAHAPGTYQLQVTTASNCTSSDSALVTMEQVAAEPHVNCPQNTTVANVFTWDAVPGATGYEVSLDGVSGWMPPSSGTMGLTHTTPLTVVTLFVRAFTSSLCPAGPGGRSEPCEVVISNIITPNVDGKNDYFFIKNLDQFPGTTVKILNRWGLNVYNSSDYKNDWNGDVPDGVYFYTVSLPGAGEKTGTVTIQR